jgi:hypothetical protein
VSTLITKEGWTDGAVKPPRTGLYWVKLERSDPIEAHLLTYFADERGWAITTREVDQCKILKAFGKPIWWRRPDPPYDVPYPPMSTPDHERAMKALREDT